MGLCKCPKRDVTNQFCYEHRVNVCEHCMVKSHAKCIIQSYIQWLKDSDYNSSCPLCGDMLESDECTRLVCYHVFHWKCLDQRQSQLPLHTAPGGHTCPSCAQNIFPASNLVSPVADVLRNKLAQVNWGRNELSLPLFAEEENQKQKVKGTSSSSSSMVTMPSESSFNRMAATTTSPSSLSSGVSVDGLNASQHQIIKIDAQNSFAANSRRPLLARESPIGSSDRDDNKYRRKTPLELVNRWTRRFYSPSSRPPWRRTWFLVLAGVLMFLLLIYVMAKLGRGGGDGEGGDEGRLPDDFRHHE